MKIKHFFRQISRITGGFASFPMNHFVPVYHCISNEYIPHVKNVIRYKNVRDFDRDIDFISKKFEFADWDYFKINYNKKLPKPLALLTFDDGLSEFRDVVVPILEQKGIFALNFVNPKFIGNQDLMFRFKASLIVDNLDSNEQKLKKISDIFSKKRLNINEIKLKILQVGYNQEDILENAAKILEFDFKRYLSEHKPYMELNDLHALTGKGFGIAAHSWDHPLISELALPEQLLNVEKSLEYMRKNDLNAEAFAFPFTDFGVKTLFFSELFRRNPDLALTFGTAGLKLDSFQANLQRIPMEMGASAENEIACEQNYFMLKNLLGKNKIDRD